MSKAVSYCVLIVTSGILVLFIVFAPELISDKNTFLREFVNHNLLSTLGVILAITLASASHLHLALNRIEEKKNKSFLNKTRTGIHNDVYWLVWLFIIAVATAIIKPILGDNDRAQALCNGFSIFLVLLTVLILIAFTRLFFAIGPDLEE